MQMTVLVQLRSSAGQLAERQLWADNVGCTASVQIDTAEARHMDMRPDKGCSDSARDGAEEMRLPRDAGLARKNAPENGAIEDSDQ